MQISQNRNPIAEYFVGIVVISIMGFAYAPFVMWFWDLLVCKIVSCATPITYIQSYLAYLFFVVLPKIMPIRFNLRNQDKKTTLK